MTDDFHEQVIVRIELGRTAEPGEINRHLKAIGFKLNYDVYMLPRTDPGPYPEWQSKTLVWIYLLRNDKEVDAQDACDSVELRYPLATIDSSLVDAYIGVVEKVHGRLGGTVTMNGSPASRNDIERHITVCISSLMAEWGEEPGSRTLRHLIESTYPR